jgi:hypothetical protein
MYDPSRWCVLVTQFGVAGCGLSVIKFDYYFKLINLQAQFGPQSVVNVIFIR